MSTYSLIEIFTMIFVTMGPIKVLVTFAEKTLDLDKTVRHRIAIRAVTVATVVGLVFIFFGFLLMKVFKFSSLALSLAGGLILLIYSIKSILKEPKKGEKRGYATDREAEQMAIYPLAVPLMASPMGLVVLTSISASKEIGPEAFAILTAALLVVMVVNTHLQPTPRQPQVWHPPRHAVRIGESRPSALPGSGQSGSSPRRRGR